jgi:uncharacterized protein (DUF952 family)
MEPIYKILADSSAQKLDQLDAIELQPTDLTSKFVHCTFNHQTQDKIQKFYPGQVVYVAELDMYKLIKEGFILVVESNPGGQNKYPHLYHLSGKAEMIPKKAIKSIKIGLRN